MARTKGSFSLGGTLEILADAPADARLQVKTLADLTASGSFPYKYVGMIVSVESEDKAYMLIGSDPTVSENWQELGSGTSLPTGGTQGQALIKQSSDDGDADWEDIPVSITGESIAPVEDSTTATNDYSVNDHLIIDGELYIATQDITTGDSLVVGTNIELISLDEEIGLTPSDWPDIITPLPGEALDGVIISPEERRVGWYYNMNGNGTRKPLYQKTVTVTTGNCTTMGSGVDTFTPIGASVESFISVIGVLNIDGAFQNLNSSFLYGTATGFASCVGRANNFSGDNKNSIHVRNAMPGWGGFTAYVTARYIKTTDSYE